MKLFIHIFYFFYRPLLLIIFTLTTLILGFAAFIVCYFDPGGNKAYKIGRFWAWLNLVASGVLVSVEGKEHIDKNQPCILMSNHESHYDVWALIAYIPIQLRWVMKIELRKIPVFGFCCERMGQIYIDRSDPKKSHESLKVAGEKIRNGASVVFFPEGTRSPDGKLLPFKKGGFVIALEANVPILPVTVIGGRKILPKKSIWILPGRMTLKIHEPIPVDGYSYETKEGLIEKVRGVIEKDME
jgi:1-acyl-sn-glycerol-3-phosphate acyltransferase